MNLKFRPTHLLIDESDVEKIQKMDPNESLTLIFGDPLQRDEQRNIDQPFTALFSNYMIEANTTMVKIEGSGGEGREGGEGGEGG